MASFTLELGRRRRFPQQTKLHPFTTPRSPMLHSLVEPIASSLGARTDQLLFIIVLLGNVPLSSVIPRLEEPWKHVYSLVLSWFILWPVLGLRWGYVQLLGQALVSFGVCKVASQAYARQQITWPWPWLVFFVSMGHLLTIHIVRYVSNASPDEVCVCAPSSGNS